MDVQVDSSLIRLEREKRAWSQEHLAGAAGIGVRTIQRIEATGVASYDLLKDYQKVRVLRAVEQWVTETRPPTDAANTAL